jgi:hypothetical protein
MAQSGMKRRRGDTATRRKARRIEGSGQEDLGISDFRKPNDFYEFKDLKTHYP